ncbi:hypothetical protein SKAU_G00210490 [Synaphobranchus kaupii]|uniref:CCHC-type domain-containing protein n=1 Tax=Synaphobranchus kaupii TaxID=118154 RepID=A0A9Q1F915_SYNKA|nr:hypothetical protein SKAU_G00210490 [Synaphobranchus kaupii]
MQIDRTHLTPAECQHRIKSQFCLYCGDPNHFIANCPVKSQCSPIARGLQVSVTPLQQSPNTRSLVSASLLLDGHIQVVSVLMDSGPDGNFMDTELVSQLHLTSIPIQNPLEALAIIRIIHVTPPVPAVPADAPRREATDLSSMPPEYLDLREVFSKSRATSPP